MFLWAVCGPGLASPYLPALLPAAPVDAADTATREQGRVGWLHLPDVATRTALLRAKVAGLRAEAATLMPAAVEPTGPQRPTQAPIHFRAKKAAN